MDTPPLGTTRLPPPAVSIRPSTVREIYPRNLPASGPRQSTPPVSVLPVANPLSSPAFPSPQRHLQPALSPLLPKAASIPPQTPPLSSTEFACYPSISSHIATAAKVYHAPPASTPMLTCARITRPCASSKKVSLCPLRKLTAHCNALLIRSSRRVAVQRISLSSASVAAAYHWRNVSLKPC